VPAPVNRFEVQIALSPDGKALAVARGRARSGAAVASALSPDGKALAVARPDLVEVWDVGPARLLWEQKAAGLNVAWSPDGRLLAVVDGKNVAVFGGADGKLVHSLAGCKENATRLAWTPDGKSVSATASEQLCVWDPFSGRPLNDRKHPGVGQGPFQWLDNGATIVCVKASQVTALDIKSGEGVLRWPNNSYDVWFSSDGLLFVRCQDGTFDLCRLVDGGLVGRVLLLEGNQDAVISPDGHYTGPPGMEKRIVYVVLTDRGEQLTLSPEEFSKKYGWKNDGVQGDRHIFRPEGGQKMSQSPGAKGPAPAVACFNEAKAKQYQEAWATHLNTAVVTTNSIGMKLVLIPPGEFDMGSTQAEIDQELREVSEGKLMDRQSGPYSCYLMEGPQHHVRITRPFYLGMYEVTVGQFRQFVRAEKYETDAQRDGKGGGGYNADRLKCEEGPKYTWQNVGWTQSDNHPVVNLTWPDAAAFCRWLSAKEDKRYWLPTEAQWEYACRAGTTTRYSSGDDRRTLQQVANVRDESLNTKRAAWTPPWPYLCPWNDNYPFTAPVGSFRPNAFGLHDMMGNATEWCADLYFVADRYRECPQDDPIVAISASWGSWGVTRGGAWSNTAYHSASRNACDFLTFRNSESGFRVACEVGAAPGKGAKSLSQNQPVAQPPSAVLGKSAQPRAGVPRHGNRL